jgi:hypothetical protein
MSIKALTTRTALLALTLAAAACGSDTTAPDPSVGTTYALVGVEALGNLGGGGSGIPVAFTDGAGRTLAFESGSLVLAPDGSFNLTVNVDFDGDEYDAGDLGSYSMSGASISLVSELDDATYAAAVVGSTLTTTYRVAGQQFELTLEAD